MKKSRINFIILLVMAFALLAPAANKKVGMFKTVDSVTKPEYLKRKGAAWKKRTRLVGLVKKAPAKFIIRFEDVNEMDPEKIVVLSQECNGNLTVYETDWLRPGTYNIIITAEGYQDFPIKKVQLKARSDCLINILFSNVEYRQRLH